MKTVVIKYKENFLTRNHFEIKRIHDLPNKEIAKQIRKDLKELFEKDFKFSVTSPNNSINISIMEGNIEFLSKEYQEAEKKEDWEKCRELKENHKRMYFKMNDDKTYYTYSYRTKEGENILDIVEKILKLYNHDNSDSMTDYFDVNYYGTVEIGKWDKNYKIIS